jgi:VanZ family protein
VRRAIPWLAAALAYAALIYWLSSQASPLPFLPSSLLSEDKVLHAAEYAVLGGLLAMGLRGLGLAPLRASIAAVLLASAYGATDEVHQSRVPNRDADVRDWMADTAGACLGAAGVAVALRRRGTRASIAP